MFRYQLTLSQPRVADYTHQIILAPPDFQTFRRPCILTINKNSYVYVPRYLESIHQFEFSRKIVYCIQNTVESCASIIYTPIDHFQFEMRINLFTKFSYDYLKINLTQIDLNHANIKIVLFIYLSQF